MVTCDPWSSPNGSNHQPVDSTRTHPLHHRQPALTTTHTVNPSYRPGTLTTSHAHRLEGRPRSLPRSEDAKRASPAAPSPSPSPRLCAPAARRQYARPPTRAHYSCRSTPSSARDWTNKDASHRPLRPLTSSPWQTATQRRLPTRERPPLHRTPR